MAREEVKNILHNMHIDHDIFSEDEKVLLEKGGYSVSESEHVDEDHHSDDDYERKIMEVISPEIGFYGGGKSAGDFEYGERDVLEERYRFENNYLQLQMANQKAAFYKKVGELERAMDRLRREKKGLENINVTQK